MTRGPQKRAGPVSRGKGRGNAVICGILAGKEGE